MPPTGTRIQAAAAAAAAASAAAAAAAAGGPQDPALLQAVEKLTQEVGGVKDQLAALSKVAQEEVRWGRVRSAMQELRAAECPYGRGGDCYLGTTREMLEWALRHMLRPGRFHIDLHDFYCELWAKESGDKPYHFYGRRGHGPADKVVLEQLLSELVALTGLHLQLVVVSYDQQYHYIEEST